MKFVWLRCLDAVLVVGLVVALAVSVGASEPTTIQFATAALGSQAQGLYDWAIEEFEAQNPGVKVNHIQTTFAQIRKWIAAGEAPDVFEMHSEFYAVLAEAGVFLDIMPFVEKENYDLGRFFPPSLADMQWKGIQAGLPYATHMMVYFINRDHFNDSGVGIPPADWTWEDFADTAVKLTRDTNGDGSADRWGAGIDFNWGALHPFIQQSGVDYFNADYTKTLIDSPEVEEALSFLLELRDVRNAVAPIDIVPRTAFQDRAVSMYLSGPWAMLDAINSLGESFDVLELPRHRRPGGHVSVLPLHISANTEHPDVAWRFLKFMASDEAQRQMMAQVTWEVPARRNVVSDFLADTRPPANREAFINVLEYGRSYPKHPRWSEIKPHITKALNAIWRNQMAVRPAIDEAARLINPILEDYGASDY